MAYRVELTRRAAYDLGRIYEHINAECSPAASIWYNGLERAVDSLEQFPRRCQLAPESKTLKRPLRQFLYGNKPHVYRTLYEIDEANKTVYVLTIRHGAMDELRAGDIE